MDMGAQNQRFRATGNLIAIEQARRSMQESIDLQKGIDARRRLGQFSTPFDLAKEIASYGLTLLPDHEILFLEPCIGSGAFFSALLNTVGSSYEIKKAAGIEIDPVYYDCAVQLWNASGIDLIYGDFTSLCPTGKYNLVLTNPPYVRHHYLTRDGKTRLLEIESQETGIALSGLAGLYCHFLLLSHKWLAPGAVCGWLLPSEFMDVNYGTAIKEYLLHHVRLLRIHRYAPEKSLFPGALVSSCVVWYRNERADDDYEIELSFGGSHEKPLQTKQVRKSELMTERKWTRFPVNEIRLKERAGNTLGDFFEIKRGLATGDNEFFILQRERIRELGLDMRFFKPVLPSPRNLKTDLILSDSNGIPQIEPQYFLLDCALPEQEIAKQHPATWDYLQSGIETTSNKYLCRNRKKWYCQEQRPASRFLCSYMGRGKNGRSPIRFILNQSEAVATNSYLMLYPKASLAQAISQNPNAVYQIWEALRAIHGYEIEAEGRVYGGGLKKIEPRELAKVPCDDLLRFCTP